MKMGMETCNYIFNGDVIRIPPTKVRIWNAIRTVRDGKDTVPSDRDYWLFVFEELFDFSILISDRSGKREYLREIAASSMPYGDTHYQWLSEASPFLVHFHSSERGEIMQNEETKSSSYHLSVVNGVDAQIRRNQLRELEQFHLMVIELK